MLVDAIFSIAIAATCLSSAAIAAPQVPQVARSAEDPLGTPASVFFRPSGLKDYKLDVSLDSPAVPQAADLESRSSRLLHAVRSADDSGDATAPAGTLPQPERDYKLEVKFPSTAERGLESDFRGVPLFGNVVYKPSDPEDSKADVDQPEAEKREDEQTPALAPEDITKLLQALKPHF